MITLSSNELATWKEVFATDGIHYETDEEYVEAVNNLVGYFDILIQMDLAQKEKLTNSLLSGNM